AQLDFRSISMLVIRLRFTDENPSQKLETAFMYAMVEIQGRQYKAEKGSLLKVNKLPGEQGQTLEFDHVLMLRDENEVKIGTPYVAGATVKAVLEGRGRDPKVIVFKYKRRKDYRVTQGHRQDYALLRVQEIAAK
ncbi:MAG TPA: 50S ribosomal protein L21, partial [Spirochaetia bacterium]|nr:50S ribosomal protein L21 [Spirochaetia bacterium]